ncbi:hypothetical protein AB0I60_26800 [Actinosynnema sp. NPDC050436]|uniref:hypothetical protein n=1 Tax=Actinosynnema sp. NPDC050436 TaxID=3155659 RepID=UPI0033FC536A
MTIVVSVGDGSLFIEVATAAVHHGLRVVSVEPEDCRALNAALEHGRPVDVGVRSIAADSPGARRVSDLALKAARRAQTHSVPVDATIAAARQTL